MEVMQRVDAFSLFGAMTQQTNQLESLANSALTSGIDLYMKKNYEGAIKAFRRSVGLAPASPHSVSASNYMANAYLKLNDVEGAIKAYKTSINLDPFRDDTHITLGNLYYSQGRYVDAEKEYLDAVRLNPNDNNYYALGQVYLSQERLLDAEKQFEKVERLSPEKPNGKFGLGLTRSKQGRHLEAIGLFEDAIGIKNDFYDAYAEMGYAYADIGKMDKAQKLADFLEDKAPELSDTLSRYMYKTDPPKIMFAWSSSTFPFKATNRKQVGDIDAYLQNAGASKSFTMEFLFDKEMDRASVESIYNWSIKRSTLNGPGKAYNFGLPIPDTEINMPHYPDSVYYDVDKQTAVLRFTLTQNESANGTIDPSHIEFVFKGKDAYGLKMDPKADQFTGFSDFA
jgi:tetratricopeptide (TPR) repeat protein